MRGYPRRSYGPVDPLDVSAILVVAAFGVLLESQGWLVAEKWLVIVVCWVLVLMLIEAVER